MQFLNVDPLQEYRWVDVPDHFQHVAETVWAYGGKNLTLSDQLLTPHWKICAGIERLWDASGETVTACNSVLLGPVGTPRQNCHQRGYELIAVRLNPERASLVVGISPKDVLDTDIRSLDLPVFGAALRLAEAGAAANEVGSALLNSILQSGQQPKRAVDEAAALIRRTKGQVAVAALAAETGLNIRTLRRFFDAELGISPKTYCRSVRLKSLLLHADQTAKPRWCELVLQFGYSDQSHMCAEVQQLTGVSPAFLHAVRRNGESWHTHLSARSGTSWSKVMRPEDGISGPDPSG